MSFPTYWLSLIMAAAALVTLGFAAETLRLRRFPGKRSFLLMLLAVAWWNTAIAIEHAVPDPAAKVFWNEFAWLGIAGTPGFWVLFIWNYIHGPYRPVPRLLYGAMSGTIGLAWVVALTNGTHHLMYRATVPVGAPPAMTIDFFHGPFYFAMMAVFYTANLLSMAFVIYEAVRASAPYRAHYLGFAAALLLPWILNIGYAAGLLRFGTADLTPVTFAVMNVIFLWLIGRRHLFDLLPLAQEMLLHAVPDPVIVLDGAGRVFECNAAARLLLGDGPAKGATLDTVPDLRDALAAQGQAAALPREISIGRPPRTFELAQVPLTFAGRAMGRLILLREITHHKGTEAQLQTALADLQRQLAANQALQQRLRDEAIHDALTGLHNRRFFQEIAPVMLAEAQRSGAPLAAAMIDLDHFKRLNDAHGHAAGDAVLRAVGTLLRTGIRQNDMVFRMGGEEFLILLPHTPADQVLRRIEERRAAFAAAAVVHEGVTLTATFSAGVAVFPDDADGIDALLSSADQALYRAKTGGRNRVEG